MTPEELEYHGRLMRLILNDHVGRDKAIPVPDLAPLIDLRSNRDYRDVREVRDFIEEDYPVLSDATGMWRAESPKEVEEVMASIHRTAKSMLRRYSRLRRQKKRRWPNWQPTLWRDAA